MSGEAGIFQKHFDDTVVMSRRYRVPADKRDAVNEKVRQFVEEFGKDEKRPLIVVLDWGTVFNNEYDIEVCRQVKKKPYGKGVSMKTLQGGDAFTLMHRGPFDGLEEKYQKLIAHMRERGLRPWESGREIYHVFDLAHPERNQVEIVFMIHDWTGTLKSGLERVAGTEEADKVMAEALGFTYETKRSERREWVEGVLERMDHLLDEKQKYEVLSCCADKFPAERIKNLRTLFEHNHSVDEVLAALQEDRFWYARPKREGNLIIETKLPYNEAAYAKAKTDEERRKAACHCSMIRDSLDGISPTYCYCGAGWYRQFWEGVLGQQLEIDLVKSLVKGDDVCQFAIHLPPDLVPK